MNPQMNRDSLQARLDASPFDRSLGLSIDVVEPEGLRLTMDWYPKRLGDPVTGALHGGAAGSVVDVAGAALIVSRTGGTVATIDFNITFHRPCLEHRIHVVARLLHLGRRTASTEVSLVSAGAAKLLATGRGVYMLLGKAQR